MSILQACENSLSCHFHHERLSSDLHLTCLEQGPDEGEGSEASGVQIEGGAHSAPGSERLLKFCARDTSPTSS